MNHQQHHQNIIEQFTRQAEPFTRLPGHINAIDLLVSLTQANASSTVLDVACGPGLVAEAFAEVAASVEGLDVTPAMLDQARRRVAAKGLGNVSFRCADAMHLPYDDNRFDIVITRYSFHHLLEPQRVFSEMLRVCKRGGVVLVADVEIETAHADLFNRIERLRDASHVRGLTPDDYAHLMAHPDITQVEKSTYGVEVELEKQLAVSFPVPGAKSTIWQLVTDDIPVNESGLKACARNGVVLYTYPIAVYMASKAG